MHRKTTLEDVIALMNRSANQLRERRKKYSQEKDFLRVHTCQDKMDELGYLLGRITANENGIRSITEKGD